jgi:hypothetical protein
MQGKKVESLLNDIFAISSFHVFSIPNGRYNCQGINDDLYTER